VTPFALTPTGETNVADKVKVVHNDQLAADSLVQRLQNVKMPSSQERADRLAEALGGTRPAGDKLVDKLGQDDQE
jgi:hypothetical protein